ncbi:MAG: hypothetical protein KF832_03680 [Caldilineaceae bacterium]|nr:hypothetical protein [Caldilineaceae bacterium]
MTTSLRFGTYLLLWVALSAAGALLAWFLRTNLFDLGIWLHWNPWVVRSVDRWAIFGLGALWLVYLFSIEGYLREANTQRQLWNRAKWIAIRVLIGLAISYGLQLLAISLPF